jgi:hypothetical protein
MLAPPPIERKARAHMCRFAAYLGEPALVDDPLYEAPTSA